MRRYMRVSAVAVPLLLFGGFLLFAAGHAYKGTDMEQTLYTLLSSTLDEPKRSWIVEAISQSRDDNFHQFPS